jgi:hypothetical protein
MAKFNLGQVFLPVLTDVTEQVGALTGHFNNLTDTQKSIVGWGVATSGALATVGGSALLLIGYLPRLKAGFDLLAGSAGVLMFTKLAAVLGAVGSAAWAGKRIWDAHNESVDMAAIKMNAVTEVNRAAYESLQTINTELERMVREGWDPATVIMGDMNLSLLDLRENLGMMVDPWTNVNDLIEVLNKRLNIANKETKAGADSVNEITEGTGIWGEAISGLLSPLDKLSTKLQSLRTGIGNLTALTNEIKALGFLPAVPKMIDTSAEARARAGRPDIPQNWLAEVATAEAQGTLIGLDAIEQKEKEITEYLKTHKKLAEEINEADKAARSEPWAIDPLEKIRAKNKEWLDEYENDTKTALDKTESDWRIYTSEVEEATADMFVNMMDPRVKDTWWRFWDDLGDIAIGKLAEIASEAVWGQLGKHLAKRAGLSLPAGTGPVGLPGGSDFVGPLPVTGSSASAMGLWGAGAEGAAGGAGIAASAGWAGPIAVLGYGLIKQNQEKKQREREWRANLAEVYERYDLGADEIDYLMDTEARRSEAGEGKRGGFGGRITRSPIGDSDPYGREVINPNLAPAAPYVSVGRIVVVLPDLHRTTPAEIETMINTQLLPAIQSAVQRGYLNRIILTT